MKRFHGVADIVPGVNYPNGPPFVLGSPRRAPRNTRICFWIGTVAFVCMDRDSCPCTGQLPHRSRRTTLLGSTSYPNEAYHPLRFHQLPPTEQISTLYCSSSICHIMSSIAFFGLDMIKKRVNRRRGRFRLRQFYGPVRGYLTATTLPECP